MSASYDQSMYALTGTNDITQDHSWSSFSECPLSARSPRVSNFHTQHSSVPAPFRPSKHQHPLRAHSGLGTTMCHGPNIPSTLPVNGPHQLRFVLPKLSYNSALRTHERVRAP